MAQPCRASIPGSAWKVLAKGLKKTFDRLPAQVEALVSPELWRLPQNQGDVFLSPQMPLIFV
ncbi:hypothetical protein [Mucilaginibacter sp.]|uniref:hypothetical protein n=1 Tax=Mucilaginibacter sp. TaxID=1882438 RepID=UPI002601105A|nr:hypothetical protein [Mucilaginibacter sp.]